MLDQVFINGDTLDQFYQKYKKTPTYIKNKYVKKLFACVIIKPTLLPFHYNNVKAF